MENVQNQGRCFLFLGPELGEKDDAVAEIRRSWGGAGETGLGFSDKSGLEEISFYAGDTPMTEISAALRNGSLFTDTRLFLIKNIEVIKKKDELELLISCVKSPQRGTIVILLSDETRVSKPLEDAVPSAGKRIFWELFENRKAGWVRDFFRREGCRISEEGIARVLELVENNTEALKRECGRLARFLGKEKVIGADDAEEWLSHSREESSFTLFSRLAAGDLSGSLESLRALLGAKESFQSILGGLGWCFKRLRDYEALAESGRLRGDRSDDFELKKIGLSSPKSRGDYQQANRVYGPGAADRFLFLTAEYDIKLRSSGAALEVLLLEILLYKIISGRMVRR
ncbi:MAG: DNA polymerase III subunit delta [Treponema sp.]|jgi:DNA polymerase-3 subunit delta|nr:DNA polymerase III subunit delta [Treponema sp.]